MSSFLFDFFFLCVQLFYTAAPSWAPTVASAWHKSLDLNVAIVFVAILHLLKATVNFKRLVLSVMATSVLLIHKISSIVLMH